MPFWEVIRGAVKKSDPEGDLIYRGTRTPTDAMRPGAEGKITRSDQFWGTDNPTVANQYAGVVPELADEVELATGVVIPARARFKKPLVIDARGHKWSDIPADSVSDPGFHEMLLDHGLDDAFTTDVAAAYAQKAGYDGVIFRNVVDPPFQGVPGIPADTYVALKPGTVRSGTTGDVIFAVPAAGTLAGAMAAAGITFGGADDAEAAGWRVVKAAKSKGSTAPTMKMGDWGLSDNVHPNPTPTGNKQVEAMGIRNMFRYVIHKGDKEVGVVEGVVTQKPGAEPQAYIAWVGPASKKQGEKIEGFLHPGVIKGFRERFRQDFPEVKNFGGFRIGGSMEGQAVSRRMPGIVAAGAGGAAASGIIPAEPAEAAPTHEQGSEALRSAASLPLDLLTFAGTGMTAEEAFNAITEGDQMVKGILRGDEGMQIAQAGPPGATPVDEIQMEEHPPGATPVEGPPPGATPVEREPPSGFWDRIGSRISGTDVDDPQMYPRTSAMIAGGVAGGMGLASKTPGPPHVKAAAGAIGGATGVVAGALFPEATMEFLEATGMVPEGFRDRHGLSNRDLQTVAEGELLLDVATGGGVAAMRGLSRGVSRLLTGPTPRSRQLAEDAAAEGINLMPIMVGDRHAARMYVNVAGRFPLIAGPLRRQGQETVTRLHEAYQKLPERIAPVAAQSDIHMKVMTEMGGLVERVNNRFVKEFDNLLNRPDVAVSPQRTANAIQDMVDEVGDLIPTPGPVTQGRPQQVVLPGRVSELQKFLNKTLLPMAREGQAADQTLKQMDNLLGAVDREIAKFAGRGDQEAVGILNRVRMGIQYDMVGNLRGAGAAEAAADLQRLTGEWTHAVEELVSNGIARRLGITPAEGFRALRYTGSRDTVASTIGVVMRSEDPAMVNDLARVLDQKTFREMASGVLTDRVAAAFERTADGALQFNPSKFSKSLGLDKPGSGLYKQTEALLQGTHSGLTMKNLEQLNEYSRAIASAPIPDVSTFIARRGTIGGLRSIMTAAIPTMAGGIATGGLSGAIGGLMLVLGARGISQAIANPANARLLRRVIDQDVKTAVRWGAYERLGRMAIQGMEDAYEIMPETADMYRAALDMFKSEYQKYEARLKGNGNQSPSP